MIARLSLLQLLLRLRLPLFFFSSFASFFRSASIHRNTREIREKRTIDPSFSSFYSATSSLQVFDLSTDPPFDEWKFKKDDEREKERERYFDRIKINVNLEERVREREGEMFNLTRSLSQIWDRYQVKDASINSVVSL